MFVKKIVVIVLLCLIAMPVRAEMTIENFLGFWDSHRPVYHLLITEDAIYEYGEPGEENEYLQMSRHRVIAHYEDYIVLAIEEYSDFSKDIDKINQDFDIPLEEQEEIVLQKTNLSPSYSFISLRANHPFEHDISVHDSYEDSPDYLVQYYYCKGSKVTLDHASYHQPLKQLQRLYQKSGCSDYFADAKNLYRYGRGYSQTVSGTIYYPWWFKALAPDLLNLSERLLKDPYKTLRDHGYYDRQK